MPVTTPPVGGPLGRSRRRLSGSAYSTWRRCQTEWRITRGLGLGSPTSPSQVLGHVLEEGVIRLIMRHAPAGADREVLLAWLKQCAEEEAVAIRKEGVARWDDLPWRREWETPGWPFTVEDLTSRVWSAVELLMVEVDRCVEVGGGPHLHAMRAGEHVFDTPAPCDGSKPEHPLPDRWPPHLEPPRKEGFEGWQGEGAAVNHAEAWEVIRPWVKDPRVGQPQRMFHPEGWAAGELDMVLRWDGNVRLVDLKSGNGGGPYGASLHDQMRFYGWLWEACFGVAPDGIEGWYLDGGKRAMVEPFADFDEATSELESVAMAMAEGSKGAMAWPLTIESPCDRAQCRWCALDTDEGVLALLDERCQGNSAPPSIVPPFEPLSRIPHRVDVRGTLDGKWGPLPNHFGESVIGAALTSGRAHVALEESQPGAAPGIHDIDAGPVLVRGALPGAWRRSPRLYADAGTTFHADDPEADVTRLGMLRTRANVSALVVSIGRGKGIRLDGRPWSMGTLHVYDGERIIEVAMFGSSLTDRILDIRPGDHVKLTGAELGWREGMPQLRIDARSTRVEVEHHES